ncbi:RNA-binding domain-containing protein [Amniculicola lignicola CBS 123094]|uniref:RNA-binding domain-containing protein n=1 Tax=Amniculicola lignicola CBS 123094 TaxID=1392246 RepID=A0A6A5WZG5_9PLEO|nr:RNA-binding domain-containing protein [Amniculicola lignicola CBS 123094]
MPRRGAMSGPGARHWEQDKEATVYVGNLDERVTDAIVWELMVQVGRVQNVHLPKDRVTQNHQGYGFVEFQTEEDAEYAGKIMNQVRLYGKPIRVNKASADKQKSVEVGAELFIGNLDSMVDEKTLYDTFGRFGTLSGVPKIARDEMGLSKGYGFISYGDFEASDSAIGHMHGQYIMNKEISVQYAYKKDGKGERHGDEAERMLAKQAKAHGIAPAVQPLPAHLFQAPPQPITMAPAIASHNPIPMAIEGRGVPGAPSGPASFSGPPGGRPPASLPPPPSGLPARPPSGAPANFFPPPAGFSGPPPQGFMPGPPGYPPAVPGHHGFGGPPGAPPPGAYGRR